MNLFEKACDAALLDTYWDLAICNKMMQNHHDWDWLKAKKAELEAKEKELVEAISLD